MRGASGKATPDPLAKGGAADPLPAPTPAVSNSTTQTARPVTQDAAIDLLPALPASTYAEGLSLVICMKDLMEVAPLPMGRRLFRTTCYDWGC